MRDLTVTNAESTLVMPDRQGCPIPHPEPAVCRVNRARDTLSEALDTLRSVQHELSRAPGTRPERTHEWWLGHLQMLSAYLLVVMEDKDAATR